MSERKELFELVKLSDEKPAYDALCAVSFNGIDIEQMAVFKETTQCMASGNGAGYFHDKFEDEYNHLVLSDVTHWLKPIQSSLKEIDESLISYKNPEAIEKFKASLKEETIVQYYNAFKRLFDFTYDILGGDNAPDSGDAPEFIESKKLISQWEQSSLTPKSIRDSEATLIEEIRQIKAAIIHFATLDKMPTLELLDREQVIAHVVTIAQKILRDYPPKKQL